MVIVDPKSPILIFLLYFDPIGPERLQLGQIVSVSVFATVKICPHFGHCIFGEDNISEIIITALNM
ncbi:hypothetical protein COU23_02095 [Candidatus Kuenenbacteria bacterium CG10_big_fil_rev_8_21_14_0_10_36_11]|uniref:Uncharacterized protein n=1 Tax=Candidatus Kuenenbacteria bacterium CG10_big_fil_rev_8_21_14_0_10_36_11 TaxID=1974618 RepID=A0A2M6WAG0_9BACT|nr:MAG: hypothetical protein COU23_02095 [Candidatus Kuenenbacteria bacterium CG10_big_fil_rev_8_21_14_0_10_36_11]